MQKVSIIPFVEGLAAKAGQVDKDNAEEYLAREVMSTGLALAAFLDEFHPNPLVFSAGVKRLTRRLIVIEAALGLERKDRGFFYEKQFEFIGIGGGPSSSTQQELRFLRRRVDPGRMPRKDSQQLRL